VRERGKQKKTWRKKGKRRTNRVEGNTSIMGRRRKGTKTERREGMGRAGKRGNTNPLHTKRKERPGKSWARRTQPARRCRNYLRLRRVKGTQASPARLLAGEGEEAHCNYLRLRRAKGKQALSSPPLARGTSRREEEEAALVRRVG
jgi:hypothetical protein